MNDDDFTYPPPFPPGRVSQTPTNRVIVRDFVFTRGTALILHDDHATWVTLEGVTRLEYDLEEDS